MAAQVVAGTGVACRTRGDARPVRPAEHDRVPGRAVVGGAAKRVGSGVGHQAGDGRCADAGQVHEMHDGSGHVERGQGVQAGAQGGGHPRGPARRLDERDGCRRRVGIGRHHGPHPRCLRADDHDDRLAPGSGQHANRAPDQRLAVQLDERLRTTHPPTGAGGEEQAGRYRLISVTGCS